MRKQLSPETIYAGLYMLPRRTLCTELLAAQRLSLQIFLTDPHAPWQCGTNENTNSFPRQYLPKGTDLSGYTQHERNASAHQLNTRPRKCLDFATPPEVYAQLRYHSPVALGT